MVFGCMSMGSLKKDKTQLLAEISYMKYHTDNHVLSQLLNVFVLRVAGLGHFTEEQNIIIPKGCLYEM